MVYDTCAMSVIEITKYFFKLPQKLPSSRNYVKQIHSIRSPSSIPLSQNRSLENVEIKSQMTDMG